jgi:hypothetical protein
MENSEFSAVGQCCDAPSDFGTAGPDLRWQLQQVLSQVRPEDLSAREIAALLAILASAHCRVIAGPAGRPSLRVLEVFPAPKPAQQRIERRAR